MVDIGGDYILEKGIGGGLFLICLYGTFFMIIIFELLEVMETKDIKIRKMIGSLIKIVFN